MNFKRKYDSSSTNDWASHSSTVKYDRSLRLDDRSSNISEVCKRTEIIRDGRKFPVFQKPSVVDVFSVDSSRRFLPDERQIKYLFWSNHPNESNKRVNFNLNEGIDNHISKDELIDEKLTHIFDWIKSGQNHKEYLNAADFVSFRGLLTTVMCTPYEQQEGWIICATRQKNTIFLCAFDTEKRKKDKADVTEKLKRFQSWGYKFEQFMLSDQPGQKPVTTRPVVETEELACVFRSKLSGNSLLYVAEMDGVCSNEPVTAAHLRAGTVPFIELKTSRHIETQRQDTSFKRHKLLKWWCQSFLVGIETIYCGFRDDDGIVSSVKEYRIKDLPKMAKGLWDPCVCMNFCVQFLDFVKSCINGCPRPDALWKFEWTPRNSITGQEIDANSEFSFIPEWYQYS